MPYRVNAVVPRFYRSQTRGADAAMSAWHPKFAPDAHDRKKALYFEPADPDYSGDLVRLSVWRNWQCRPVEPERLPQRLYLEIDDPPLLDLYTPAGAGKAFVASARLRGLVEVHEPGVHQFVPVALMTRKGAPIPEPYFFLVNQRCAFGVDFARSEAGFRPDTPDPDGFRMYRFEEPNLHFSKKTFEPRHNLSLEPTLVLKRSVVGGFHLWREVAVGIGKGFVYDDLTLFMSDALFTAVMTQSLQGLAASHRGVFDTDDEP